MSNGSKAHGGTGSGILDEFDPKIIGYLCNWCCSVFFFTPQSAGFGSKEKNGSKRNSPKPAPSVKRRSHNG